MAQKIGRNERCPCNSGKKYKHCCARVQQQRSPQASAEEQLKVSLLAGVERISAMAQQKKQHIQELGVFVLISTTQGNAWLFEVTQSDCVQLVSSTAILANPIDENPETIEIEWSHTYNLRNKELELTAYKDRATSILVDIPVKELNGSIRRIRKKISPELLKEIHIDQSPPAGA